MKKLLAIAVLAMTSSWVYAADAKAPAAPTTEEAVTDATKAPKEKAPKK